MCLPKKILSDLMIDETLADITPRLRRAEVVYDEENYDEYTNTTSCITAVNKKHCYSTNQRTNTSGPLVKIVERRPKKEHISQSC